MGVRRTQHIAMSHAREHHVGDVATAAFDEPWILESRNRLTYGKLTHDIPRIPPFLPFPRVAGAGRGAPIHTPVVADFDCRVRQIAGHREIAVQGLTSTCDTLQLGSRERYGGGVRCK